MLTRLQRFRQASQASGLRGLFKSRAAAPQQRPAALMVPTWAYGARPDYFDRTFENYVREGYKRNELIYSCIMYTANTASSINMLVKDKATRRTLPESPLRALLQRPNPHMVETDFWQTTIVHQLQVDDGGLPEIRLDHVRVGPLQQRAKGRLWQGPARRPILHQHVDAGGRVGRVHDARVDQLVALVALTHVVLECAVEIIRSRSIRPGRHHQRGRPLLRSCCARLEQATKTRGLRCLPEALQPGEH